MKQFLTVIMCCLPLWVAAQETNSIMDYPLDTINGEEVYQYEVERGIGLYRIGINFNVSQNEIVRFNPQLRERGLHYGETILIPTGRTIAKQTEKKMEMKAAKRMEQARINEARTALITEDSIILIPISNDIPKSVPVSPTPIDTILPDTITPDNRKIVELALMLPFESHQAKRSLNAERMVEFYQGALLALHNAQNDSTLYRLRVYDTERSERRVQQLCDSNELDRVKGIIGLSYPIQIERMAEWCNLHQVPLLLPFSDKVDLTYRPQLLQFNSSVELEADSLCQWLKKREAQYVVIDSKPSEMSFSIRKLRKKMLENGINYTSMKLDDLMADSTDYALSRDKENIIILHNDRYQRILPLVPHLKKMQQDGYTIRLLSRYSWKDEIKDIPQVYTSVFTSNLDQSAYNALWESFFVNEHVSTAPRYDLLGYDLMQALIDWIDGYEGPGLQSDIHWVQVGENGGWQNTNVQVVEN